MVYRRYVGGEMRGDGWRRFALWYIVSLCSDGVQLEWGCGLVPDIITQDMSPTSSGTAEELNTQLGE
jgi:hypothetical protein